jgi:nitrite reductase/ring-hydroxylating ferredoxin subunit/uncharacterized membrane protein
VGPQLVHSSGETCSAAVRDATGFAIARPSKMRSSAHLNGHPIHPMLVGFPAAYLFGSAAVDLWARATGRTEWFRTARHMTTLGIGTALVAAVPGLIDYVFAVPPKSSARTRATDHMFANVSALMLFSAARAGWRTDDPPRPWVTVAEACGAALVVVAGWMGGTLVYRNQIAVDHRFANAGKWRSLDIVAPDEDQETVDVGAVDELGVGQMKLVRVGNRRIVLARTEDGHTAFDDRCTHKGGPLSDGSLVCGTVQCPWHGSQFDVRTGAVAQGPAREPIATYDVTEIDGQLRLSVSPITRPAAQRADPC